MVLFKYTRKVFGLLFCSFSLIFRAYCSDGGVKCLEIDRFYRNPDRPVHKIWTLNECSKYYLCLDGEVFDFRCSTGLVFDISRQICDIEDNVDNCDLTTEETPRCRPDHLDCDDGTCLQKDYFCDGSHDCRDGSDEKYCDQQNDPNFASLCNKTLCKLPNCFCSNDGKQIPMCELHTSQIPQMIILTINGAINYENWELYNHELFNDNYRNPNNCPIRATFFITHQSNNYHQTQKLWNRGHEIAINSITHRLPEDWWSLDATIEDWFDEMIGQANILHKFSKIRLNEIRGLRAPFLHTGWNRQFSMMKEFGFIYDSSIIAPFTNPPYWPYSLDYQMPHKCIRGKCPTHSYPGIWELVMNQLEIDDDRCVMLDSCPNQLDKEEIYQMLVHNFKRHYLTNRAPFGLHLHSKWFKNNDNLYAFKKFMREVLKQQNVWFVTNWQAIEWIKNPTPINKLHNFKQWDCTEVFDNTEIACKIPNICKFYHNETKQDRYLYTCTECPLEYPWIRNEFGSV